MARLRDEAFQEDGTVAERLGSHRLRRSDGLAERLGPVDAPHADSAAASRSLDQERIADFPPRILQPFEVARSDENTPELKSLMRTSYAVFCWKKKTYNRKQQ